jgi:regulator of protease activity HflC (stomatin/prohibitin superfamily)
MLIPWIYWLKEDEQILVEALTRRYTVEGPRIFAKPPLHRVRVRRKGITLEVTDYLRVRNTLSGEVRNEVGPKMYFLKENEEIAERLSAIALKENQYIRLLDQQTGRIRVEHGESLVLLEPTEKILEPVREGVNIDEDTAILIRDISTGALELVTEHQVFFPAASQEIVQVRERISLEDHEVVVVKNPRGEYIFRKGADEERAFFVEPYYSLVEFWWSSGIHKSERSLKVTRIDTRPKFMWYEFDVRTKDNVELTIGITFFWQIVDVEKMVGTTDDAPGDLCSHARSVIIQSVSQVSLEEFLASFNRIIHTAVLEQDDTFYADRGLTIHSVEIREVSCKDNEIQRVLTEIIQETTNRLNRLQKQQSENEVAIQRVEGEIEVEEKRGKLLDLKQEHIRKEAEAEGQGEASKIHKFFDELGDELSQAEKLKLFDTLRKQEMLEALAKGNARLFLMPGEAGFDLKIEG